MSNRFFAQAILNSPYASPERHRELDDQDRPMLQVTEQQRRAEFIPPTPKPCKQKGGKQAALTFDEAMGLSSDVQQCECAAVINAAREEVDKWRKLPDPNDWRVTPNTAHCCSICAPLNGTPPSSAKSRRSRMPSGCVRSHHRSGRRGCASLNTWPTLTLQM